MNKGIHQQIQEAKVKHYNDLSLKQLELFIEERSSRNIFDSSVYPKLSRKEARVYNELIKKIKPGYIYQIGHKVEILISYKEAETVLKVCKKKNIPFLLKPDIWIMSTKTNATVKLEDITWIKDTALIEL